MMKLSIAIITFFTLVNASLGRLSSSNQGSTNTTASNDEFTLSTERIARKLGHHCGGGKIGNGICADSSLCCSQYGWCGTTADHCKGSQPAPSPAPGAGNRKSPPCGNGKVGNGICADTNLCCSKWGWCGTSSDHCAGGKKPQPQPTPAATPSPPSGGGGNGGQPAYLTYHLYYKKQPLTQVSCSDGENGLITRWGYNKIRPMWPYVAAVSNLNWNSPVCGTCYELYAASTGKTVYVTAIDKVANPGPNGELHFDMSQPSFDELLGEAGYRDGHGDATFREVDSSYCRGNKG